MILEIKNEKHFSVNHHLANNSKQNPSLVELIQQVQVAEEAERRGGNITPDSGLGKMEDDQNEREQKKSQELTIFHLSRGLPLSQLSQFLYLLSIAT